MPNKILQEAIKDCRVTFDGIVLVTDLLEEYEIPFKEVNETLSAHIKEQEKKGKKYTKQFLVHGTERENDNEIITIVEGETKLQEWLKKLKNAESSLYSVQLSGSAKPPATILKPLRYCEISIENLGKRETTSPVNRTTNGNNITSSNESQTVSKSQLKVTKNLNTFTKPKAEPKTSETAKNITPEITKSLVNSKKSPTEIQKPATEGVKTAQKSSSKINNFFGVSMKDEKKDIKDTKEAATSKKVHDFFKSEKKEIKSEPNTSIQLFCDEIEEQAEKETSSDEEEKLDAIKRGLIASDNEEEKASSSKSAIKRRRIEDSDDEDESKDKPEIKGDNEVETIEIESETPQSETYLDEDGFVKTIKSKKSNVSVKTKPKAPTPKKKSPENTSAKPKSSAASLAKTKQGNIMNYFSKK